MIVDLSNASFDIGTVCFVGQVGGDSNWRRYTVKFDNGHSMEIYDSRPIVRDAPSFNVMPRKKFYAKWKEVREHRLAWKEAQCLES
jgi:hypothetical protein